MYTRASTQPLTLNTRATANGKISAATFQYTEVGRNRGDSQSMGMSNTVAGTLSTPSSLYVRALYDYEADDRTSLSFRQGDIIQVLTRLESGWWDGVIYGVRGWFPSNYCAIVSAPEDAAGRRSQGLQNAPEASAETTTEDEYDDFELEPDANGSSSRNGGPADSTEDHEQEEAAFWIPQATPHGKLFYFNTLTGVSTMELPLEAPTSAHETGPRDRMNIHVPNQTRPPPEMWAGGIEQDEEQYDDVDSASELDGESLVYASRSGRPRRRRSYISDGVSPAASMASLDPSPITRPQGTHPSDLSNSTISMGAGQHPSATTQSTSAAATAFTSNSHGQITTTVIPRSFFDDGNATTPTWNKLVESMRRSIEAYRQVINNADRSEYVRKAEDISDHLRMLLAAASSTTDNHSGNPSIISTNKALYPHFRDMMSRFSKLVLSSHIAAADWPAPDSYPKCLQEAEGVLHGVYGFVEVARSQRGEDITRLTPGFLQGSLSGGSWQSNKLGIQSAMLAASFVDQDELDPYTEPSTALDSSLLERLDDLKQVILASIRQLEEHLVVSEKLITPLKHKQIGDAVCGSGGRVIDYFRPWMSTLECIDLSPLNNVVPNPQIYEFECQKQRLYDLVMHLMVTCQAVAAPLGDEWAEERGEPLEERLIGVGRVLRQLETCASQISFSLQLLLDSMSRETSLQQPQEPQFDNSHRRVDTSSNQQTFSPQASPPPSHSRQVRALYAEQAYPDGVDPLNEASNRKDRSKVEKFFGEVPAPMVPGRGSEETPSFLMLDHEGEISYDTKTDPPQLRGGTLTALVEQLTRHDRLDAAFNNTFLLTYRSFTSASELFKLLVKRFSIQPPRGISEDDYKTWVEKKQKLIRFRVVNVLKSWFDNYWMENNDRDSNELLRRVYSFAKDSIATTQTPGSTPLMTSVEQRLRGQDTNTKIMVPTLNTPVPPPIMPKNMKKLKFLDIDATEFARQLTIIESRLYGKIKPTECLNKTWQKKVSPEEPEPAANVKALILHSNQLTNWVAEMILTQSDVKKRVIVIKHFVAVADKCRSMNNFSTLTSIISALGTAPVHRLQRTWSQVNARTMGVLEHMRRLMGSTKNFGEYRETLHLANPPCIPFFGVYLTDLTFIEDGISSVIKKNNQINFAKRAKTAEVIRDIQQYQNVPYPLKPVTDLQDYILSNMQAAGDVHEMYEKSLAVEPREREDEKITRLLSESGFL
ncbi:MAG: hypothetical protein L6R38_008036 [Xanthoria sp. 2 TBL-2021]|nr:MAG: hypothetical protein L6R38_008036 [Xanthoria sp. 2 TBL-2021]